MAVGATPPGASSVVVPKGAARSLERLDNLGAENDLTSSTVNEAGIAIEPLREFVKRGRLGWCGRSPVRNVLSRIEQSAIMFEGSLNSVRTRSRSVSYPPV